MQREQWDVARSTVERLMRKLRTAGVIRGKPVRTTFPGPVRSCPLDRVNRQFHADRPDQLWVTPPHCPQQNGMIERVIRNLKEQCAHRHRFESQQHASRVIGDWIQFYNHRRTHQALGIKTPAEAYALAA